MGDELRLDITIGMLGARGVGKTSMIAAMWDQFGRVFPDPNLQLIPSDQTTVDLQQLLIELKRVAAGKPAYVDTGKIGLQRTMDREEHSLKLYHTLTKAEVDLHWLDYPGGWLEEKPHEVSKMLQDSPIVLVAIDAPALMEHSTGEHEAINRPASIAAALQRSLKHESNHPRLILFVPVRGERWLATPGQDSLYGRFQERYGQTLRALRGYRQNVAAVFCPIQTLGSIHFSHYVGTTPMFQRVGSYYAPQDCDQPLRYVLAFILHLLNFQARIRKDDAQKQVDYRGAREVFIDWICEVFGYPSEKVERLKRWQRHASETLELLRDYARGCKQGSPFEILQNGGLVGL
ncbi:MAG: hypothetical protein ACYC3I_27130 [Gemmataceae bacterium]